MKLDRLCCKLKLGNLVIIEVLGRATRTRLSFVRLEAGLQILASTPHRCHGGLLSNVPPGGTGTLAITLSQIPSEVIRPIRSIRVLAFDFGQQPAASSQQLLYIPS
jgi:hypothetical protein